MTDVKISKGNVELKLPPALSIVCLICNVFLAVRKECREWWIDQGILTFKSKIAKQSLNFSVLIIYRRRHRGRWGVSFFAQKTVVFWQLIRSQAIACSGLRASTDSLALRLDSNSCVLYLIITLALLCLCAFSLSTLRVQSDNIP